MPAFSSGTGTNNRPGHPIRSRPDLELVRGVAHDNPSQGLGPPSTKPDRIVSVDDDLLPNEIHFAHSARSVSQADRSAGTSYWVLILDRPTSGLDSEIRLHLSARPAVDVTSGQGLGERDGSALGYRATYPQLSHSMNAPAVSLAATRRT